MPPLDQSESTAKKCKKSSYHMHFTWVKCSDPHALYCTYWEYCQFIILDWRWDCYFYMVIFTIYWTIRRNYCWFAFALWSGCCSASFQYFVIDHLVIATVQNTTKLPPIYWIRHLPGKGRIFVFSNRSESGTLLKTHICYVSILSLD